MRQFIPYHTNTALTPDNNWIKLNISRHYLRLFESICISEIFEFMTQKQQRKSTTIVLLTFTTIADQKNELFEHG